MLLKLALSHIVGHCTIVAFLVQHYNKKFNSKNLMNIKLLPSSKTHIATDFLLSQSIKGMSLKQILVNRVPSIL
jgi:hypothetical protein